VAITTGWLNVGLGLAMIAAWHWRIPWLLQVPPGSPPIRYNTALAFVLSGLALLLLQHRRSWAWLPAVGVLAIGGLTLVQYLFQVDLGIDQWLMEDYITQGLYEDGTAGISGLVEPVQQFFILVDRPISGRPAPNVALTFTLVGIALLMAWVPPQWQRGRRWSNQRLRTLPPERLVAVTGLLAPGIAALGIVALLGYAAQIGTVQTWRYLIGISIPTALGLTALGLGLLNHAYSRHGRPSAPRWYPVGIGFGVLMASVFLWEALHSWGTNLGARLPELAREIEALLSPVANIILLQGILLALLVGGLLAVDQRLRANAGTIKQLSAQQAATASALESILESTADGILVLDPAMHLTHWNQRFLKMWGIPAALAEEVRSGSGTPNFYPIVLDQLQDPDQFRRTVEAMMAEMDKRTMDVIPLKDGRIFERRTRPQWQGKQVVGKVLSYRDVTARHQAEAVLRESEERYRSLVTALAEGIVLQGADGVVQASNERAEEILGLSMDQLQGRTSIDPRWRSIHEDGSPFPGEEHPAMVALRTGRPCRNVVMGVHKPSGELTWISINSQPMVRPGEDKPYAVVSSFADITERKHMEEALFYEKELAQVTLHSIGDAVITTDVAGRVQYINPVAEDLTGWTQAEAEGKLLDEVFQLLQDETREPVENPVFQALRENQIVGLEGDTFLVSRSGREIAIDDSAGPIRDRQGQTVGAVMVFHDVTHARQLTRQVFWQAMHDPLTGLVNRRAFEHRLEQAIQSAQLGSSVHVLCYLDLDRFKIVNDTCGHKVGDELLRQITALMQAHIRKTDTLARLGGDEFGILLQQCDLDQGLRVADGLRETVQDFRFTWDNHVFTIGASIGVVPITPQVQDLESLLMCADAACYAAKNTGRNRVHLFQPDDQTLAQQQGEIRWATRITQALENDQFCLYAQPIRPTPPRHPAIDHAEILIRLLDNDGTVIPPMAFIPAAERYGLIGKIDRWVVSTLFQHWHQVQPAAGQPPIQYAINLSGHSLTDDRMVDFLKQQFEEHGVPPHLICFEITETAAIANLIQASQFIQQLRTLGCYFALDDFGSGMSSFTYLKHLPVNYLKIDGSFVKDMVNDPIDNAMVEAISRVSQAMGLQTVAEYVENDAILQRITALGVDFAQGYGIAKPAPLW
jgi:diguanylate cyclase (GGDEF)-like protein/PAS domain S-box-containing protein